MPSGGLALRKDVKINHFNHVLLATEVARYDQGIVLINSYLMTEQERQQDFVRIPMHKLEIGERFSCL